MSDWFLYTPLDILITERVHLAIIQLAILTKRWKFTFQWSFFLAYEEVKIKTQSHKNAQDREASEVI